MSPKDASREAGRELDAEVAETMARLYCGDALEVLKTLPAESVRCCVTSPPYWGLRDYGVSGQLGLEKTPDEYVARMVAVFQEVWRVLANDGTLWLNVGDSYAQGGGKQVVQTKNASHGLVGMRQKTPGFASKQLVGIPWRLAFALQADGWYLRSDIIWSKPNPMPESVTDRPTKAHEYVFLLAKSARYFYDAVAICEPVSPNTHARVSQDVAAQIGSASPNGGTRESRPMKAVTKGSTRKLAEAGSGIRNNDSFQSAVALHVEQRNARTVWNVPTQSYAGAHFATFPEELARRCILAGSAPGDTVLDPFGGSGTVAQVATGNGRSAVYIDLNPKYRELAVQRIGPMLCEVMDSGLAA